MTNFKLVIPQNDAIVSAGRRIGEEIVGPWLDRLIDKTFDALETAIKENNHE